MAASGLYQTNIAGEAEQSRDQNAANIPRIDRRPWPVRIRTCAASKGLPPATRGFAVLLSTYFDATGRWALSIDQLADATGLTRRQVYVHLKRCK